MWGKRELVYSLLVVAPVAEFSDGYRAAVALLTKTLVDVLEGTGSRISGEVRNTLASVALDLPSMELFFRRYVSTDHGDAFLNQSTCTLAQ